MTSSITAFLRDDVDYRVSVGLDFRDTDEAESIMESVYTAIGRFHELLALPDSAVPEDDRRHLASLRKLLEHTSDEDTVVAAYSIASTMRSRISWIGDERFANELISGRTVSLMDRVRERVMCCMDASLLIEHLAKYVGTSCEILRNDSLETQELLNNRNPNHYFNVFHTKDAKFVLVDVLAIPSMYGVRTLDSMSPRRETF